MKEALATKVLELLQTRFDYDGLQNRSDESR